MQKNKLEDIESEDFPELFDEIEQLPKDSRLYTQHVLNIPRYVKFTLNAKGLNQNFLAENLQKTDAEISKWLSGKQNITLRTISRLEAALGINLINPEIKKLIDSLKGAAISKSPIYTIQGDSCNYNVFIMGEVTRMQADKEIIRTNSATEIISTSISLEEFSFI